jgi:cytochrome c
MFDFCAEGVFRADRRAGAAWGLVGIAVMLAALGFRSPGWAGDIETPARGRRIAEVACAPCHAVGPIGESPKSPAPPFRELGRRYPVESLEEALAEGVMVGHPEMPRVQMKETDIAAFVAYLKTIQVP